MPEIFNAYLLFKGLAIYLLYGYNRSQLNASRNQMSCTPIALLRELLAKRTQRKTNDHQELLQESN